MNTNVSFNSWAKFSSWQSVSPPSRPAKWQLSEVEKTIENLPRSKPVAVLGSTIEFRDLLAEMGFEKVFVFERNKGFFDYITPYAKNKDRLSEVMIEGNWIDTLPQYDNFFYAILSDLTSGNIPYASRDKFYKGVSGALIDGGVYVDRVLTNETSYYSLDELVKKYSHMQINNHSVNSFNCEVLFCSTLLNNSNVVDSSKFYDYLLSLGDKRINSFVKACYDITPRDCKWWYGKPWKQEFNRYTRYFDVCSTVAEPAYSEYYGRARLMISEKKHELSGKMIRAKIS